MDTSASKRIGIVFAAVLFAAAVSAAASAGHAIVGTVDKVDTAAKTIAVKAVDGTVEVLHFTEKTAVMGAREGRRQGRRSDRQEHVPFRGPLHRGWSAENGHGPRICR